MAVVKNTEPFEEAKFMKELYYLKDTQESIQSLSGWCIRNRKFAYKITRCWLKTAKKAKPEQRLTLFHLLNDIVQHSKRKNYTDLLEKFEAILKEIMPYMKEEKICSKVERCLNIWNERQIFPEKFVGELAAVIKQNRAEQDLIDNFQPQQVCTQIKIMRALEDDTDYKHKTLKDSDLNLVEVDESTLRQKLKDRQHGSDFIHDVDEARQRLESYIKAVDREISKRRQVIELLSHGSKYYESLLGEAQIVANAYSNFGKRVKSLQLKLVEKKLPELQTDANDDLLAAADLSPVPSPPDEDVPSPQSDEIELDLPGEQRKTEDFNARIDSIRNRMAAASESPSTGINDYLNSSSEAYTPAPVTPEVTPAPAFAPRVYTQQDDQDQPYWDPPPVTSWPAPKPDPWSDQSTTEPIPEWKIQTVDDLPDDEGDLENIVAPESYPPNLALQRLQQNASKSLPGIGDKNNLIDLTAKTQQGSEDMEMCSDDEAADRYQHNEPPHPYLYAGEPRPMTLQERLKNLAGVPNQSDPAYFSPPPRPPMAPPVAVTPTAGPVHAAFPSGMPPLPPGPPPPPSFSRANFEQRPRFGGAQTRPPHFQSPHDYRPHRPRHEYGGGNMHSPYPRGGRPRPTGPRW